jgi:hypothetical protein
MEPALRASTSASQAKGSTPLSFAVIIAELQRLRFGR